MNYYIAFHILAGWYIVDWFCSHIDRYAYMVNESSITNDPKKVMAIYLLWPILVPSMLVILHWSVKRKDT